MDPSVDIEQARAAVAATARGLAAAGLVRATSGNVSARAGELIAISPTGAPLADLQADAVAVIDPDGAQVDGPLAPTSELDLHLAVYADHGAGAVIHTHAPEATALSCALHELPLIHYELLALGGAVRVAPYQTFGTRELAAAASAALQGRTAALLANHGTIAHGGDLAAALAATELLEWGARLYRRAAACGTPRALTVAEQHAVIEAATTRRYGTTREAAPR